MYGAHDVSAKGPVFSSFHSAPLTVLISCKFLILQSFVLVQAVENRRKGPIFNYSRRENIEIMFENIPPVPL